MDAPTDRDAIIPRAPYADADPLYHALTHAHAAPEFPAFTAADALALVDQCAALDLRLPDPRMDDADRRRLGGTIFVGSPALCFTTARALREGAAEFPGAAVVARSLTQRGERALWLRGVAARLRALAQRASDLALLDQSTSTEDALKVLGAVERCAREVQCGAMARRRYYLTTTARRIARWRKGETPGPVPALHEPRPPRAPHPRAKGGVRPDFQRFVWTRFGLHLAAPPSPAPPAPPPPPL